MKKLLMASVLFLGLSLIYYYSVAEGVDWKFLRITPEGMHYHYDKEGIIHIKEDIIRVWLRISKNRIEKIKDKFGYKYVVPKDIFKLTEIKCSTKEARILRIDDHVSEGIIIIDRYASWRSITAPEMELLYTKVCPEKGK